MRFHARATRRRITGDRAAESPDIARASVSNRGGAFAPLTLPAAVSLPAILDVSALATARAVIAVQSDVRMPGRGFRGGARFWSHQGNQQNYRQGANRAHRRPFRQSEL